MSRDVQDFNAGLAFRAEQCSERAPYVEALRQALDQEAESLLALEAAVDRRDAAARSVIHRISHSCPTPSSEGRRLVYEEQIVESLPGLQASARLVQQPAFPHLTGALQRHPMPPAPPPLPNSMAQRPS